MKKIIPVVLLLLLVGCNRMNKKEGKYYIKDNCSTSLIKGDTLSSMMPDTITEEEYKEYIQYLKSQKNTDSKSKDIR
jgi:hypothetical protein